MNNLTPTQKKYLRGQAHHLNPVVMVGKQGITDALIQKTDEALNSHELIKLRFIEFKKEKKELSDEIAIRTQSEIAGSIGHVFIFYRQHEDEDKRKVNLPTS